MVLIICDRLQMCCAVVKHPVSVLISHPVQGPVICEISQHHQDLLLWFEVRYCRSAARQILQRSWDVEISVPTMLLTPRLCAMQTINAE